MFHHLRSGLRLDRWFPHVPLAVAVGALGLAFLVQPVEQLLGLSLFGEELRKATQDIAVLSIKGIPKVIAGTFLMVMSIGLLWRSRLAWITAVVTTLASLALAAFAPVVRVHTGIEAYNGLLLVALLSARRYFYRSSVAAGTLFALTSIMLLVGYSVVGSYVLGQAFTPAIEDFVTALYFAVATMSTVGYGDILPNSAEARLFVVSVIVLSITVFAASLSAIVIPMLNERIQDLLRGRQDPMTRSGHYVIIGKTALAHNTYQELTRRAQAVTVVVQSAPGDSWVNDVDVVVGDSSDLDTLTRAGAKQAKAILALSFDDSENAFVVLAAKELGEHIKTVAVVNDAKNLKRIKRVHPDMVIAPDVLGSELLAMALSGEDIDADKLMKSLLGMG